MDRLEDCISFVVGKAAQQVSRRARELLAPYEVTPIQYAVLKAIRDVEGVSGVELGARIVLDSASITGVVDRLVARKLIERRPDPNDRRVQRLHLTDIALDLLPALDLAMDQLNEEVGTIIEDVPKVIRGLRRLGAPTYWRSDV